MGTFTLETGLGMLAFGLGVTMIIAIGAFIIINKVIKKGEEHDDRSK